MRLIVSCTLTFLIATFIGLPRARAITDDESKEMLTNMVHAYYESNPDKLLKICSRFKNPQFTNRRTVNKWMKERTATRETYMKVRGVMVHGMAKITDEKLGNIEFRFDGTEKSPSRVIVVTAWLERIYEFDETVPQKQRVIEQIAVLKIYVTIMEEKYLSFKSDEINFGYYFASAGGAPKVRPAGAMH